MSLLSSRERAEQRRVERLIAAGKVTPPRGPAFMTQQATGRSKSAQRSEGFAPYATLTTYDHDAEQWMKSLQYQYGRQFIRLMTQRGIAGEVEVQ
jgi:hypothetical protein